MSPSDGVSYSSATVRGLWPQIASLMPASMPARAASLLKVCRREVEKVPCHRPPSCAPSRRGVAVLERSVAFSFSLPDLGVGGHGDCRTAGLGHFGLLLRLCATPRAGMLSRAACSLWEL